MYAAILGGIANGKTNAHLKKSLKGKEYTLIKQDKLVPIKTVKILVNSTSFKEFKI
ncbi:hypothetical protein DESHY_20013 [Desulforamulus hydrothermalis Lam5 = DSM 18033]|uniref:Uncharacterized protein n=1 Tax=Desulforamulus hydrothermalis Lam5 = DSM 18033 TaxID=1121428 RepID=K8DYY4_9FIRM|nr:hypothetical protein DESHY_20013 [Desulforamulus hydrothermalis Lam5 = DSM 18033]